MLISLMCVVSGCCVGFRLCMLCRIFVLSGWSSKPTRNASCWISLSMVFNCCNDVANSRTSSANLKLVSIDPALAPGRKCIPHCRFAHCGCSCLKIPSETLLNSRELSGSPCFVPRCIQNSRLITSVLTLPVCPV